jgi:hypothetical protein
MKTSIGRVIADAAARAVRSLGAARATLVVRPPTVPALTTRPGDGPAREAALIKIEVSLNR